MVRILVTAALLVVALGGTAQARCRVVLENGEYRLGKTAKGYELCGTTAKFPRDGRPVALASRGKLVAVRFRDGARRIIRTVEFREGAYGVYVFEGATVIGRRERFVRQAFGDYALYVAVGGQRPHIRMVGSDPSGVIDRSRGIVPRSLRRDGDVVRWRIRGEVRRVSASRGQDVPRADCRVPSYAAWSRRAGGAVAYELRLGDDDYAGTVFGCLDGGPARFVGESGNDLVIESTRPVLLGGPFAVFRHDYVWKDTTSDLFAVDLRDGATTARASIGGGFMEAVVSGTGAVAFSQRVADRQEVVTARGETVTVLDSGPSVDGRSLTLAGTTLSWVSGAQRRTAEFP